MTKEVVKLMRSPCDATCSGECGETVLMGSFAFVNTTQEGSVFCLGCGVKRGWDEKWRVKKILQKLELREDIRALKHTKKALAEEVLKLQQEIKVFEFGRLFYKVQDELEQSLALMNSYMKSGCGVAEEELLFNKMVDQVRLLQELQIKVKEEVESQTILSDGSRRVPVVKRINAR